MRVDPDLSSESSACPVQPKMVEEDGHDLTFFHALPRVALHRDRPNCILLALSTLDYSPPLLFDELDGLFASLLNCASPWLWCHHRWCSSCCARLPTSTIRHRYSWSGMDNSCFGGLESWTPTDCYQLFCFVTLPFVTRHLFGMLSFSLFALRLSRVARRSRDCERARNEATLLFSLILFFTVQDWLDDIERCRAHGWEVLLTGTLLDGGRRVCMEWMTGRIGRQSIRASMTMVGKMEEAMGERNARMDAHLSATELDSTGSSTCCSAAVRQTQAIDTVARL